jgi:hypothetical protein
MMCYAGIDLHATNSVVVLDETDRVLYQKRLRNDLPLILTALEPYRATLQGVAVESTYNWYWLVELRRARRVGRPVTGMAKQLIAIRLSPRLLSVLRRMSAKQEKPYQTLIHELEENATSRAA